LPAAAAVEYTCLPVAVEPTKDTRGYKGASTGSRPPGVNR
jgi:hypothetical protein